MRNFNESNNIPSFLKDNMGGQISGMGCKICYPNIKIGKVYYGNFCDVQRERHTTIKVNSLMLVENLRKGYGVATFVINCDTPSKKGTHIILNHFSSIYENDKDFVLDLCDGKTSRDMQKVPLKDIFVELYRECMTEVEDSAESTDRFIGYYWSNGKTEQTKWSAGPKYVWIDECGEHVIYEEETKRIFYKTRKECVMDNVNIDHFPTPIEEKETDFIIPVKVRAKSLDEALEKMEKLIHK